MIDVLVILKHFFHARRLMNTITSTAELIAHQDRKVAGFRKSVLSKSPYYAALAHAPLVELPIMDKPSSLAAFDSINTVGLGYDTAMSVALEAERNRDFAPTVNGVTVGLSSGTSGKRGVFLASRSERLRWAGVMLAKALPRSILVPHRIAFFLRANSNLYTTLRRGRHLAFDFYDLTVPVSDHVRTLNACPPDVLTAPASILKALAEQAVKGNLAISPIRIYSVAEVLEPGDAEFISQAFGQPVHQIYQCTEGFLGISQADGKIRLNEEYLIVEKEWIDRKAGRFVPIITDFTRTTQPVVRYRLDDVLVEDLDDPSPFTVLKAVEGRQDDILYFRSSSGSVPIYGDSTRQAIAASRIEYDDYRIIQSADGSLNMQFTPSLDFAQRCAAREAVSALAHRHGAQPPDIDFDILPPREPMSKFRRIMRVAA